MPSSAPPSVDPAELEQPPSEETLAALSTLPAASPAVSASTPAQPPCRRIQVSREKRPLNFFVTLSKKFLQTDDVVELSGLGLAVTTVVTIAEILRASGHASLEHIQTSLVEPHPDAHSYAPKAKIQIWLRRTSEFHSLMANNNSASPVTPLPAGSMPASHQPHRLEGDTNPLPHQTTGPS